MLKKLIPIIFVVVALVFVAVFLDGSVFVIKDVQVVGDSGMDEVDVIRLAGVNMGGRIRKLDAESIRRNVESSGALRCVDVSVDRPSTLVITVEQRVARMAVDYGGSLAITDEDGYVISVTREMPEGDYLYVTGMSARDAVPGRLIGADNIRIDALCAVLDAIDTTGTGEYISEINMQDCESIYLFSRTGIIVELGDGENLDSKLIWMKYALMDLEERGQTSGRLDVTGGKQADFRSE